jgi:hypothetical protein
MNPGVLRTNRKRIGDDLILAFGPVGWQCAAFTEPWKPSMGSVSVSIQVWGCIARGVRASSGYMSDYGLTIV